MSAQKWGSDRHPWGKGDRLIGGAGSDQLLGGAGRDQFIYNRLSDRQDTILDFTPREDKIVLRSLLDRTVRGGYRGGNAIAKGYVQFQQIGNDTQIDIDRNGKKSGGLTPLVVISDISIASLKPSNNFVF